MRTLSLLTLSILLSSSTGISLQFLITPALANECPPGECEEPPTPTPVVETLSETQSFNGSHRGAGTQMLKTALQSILLNNTRLSEEEIEARLSGNVSLPSALPEHSTLFLEHPPRLEVHTVICKMRDMLRRDKDRREARHWVAVVLHNVFGTPIDAVYTALGSKSFCEGVLSVRRTVQWRVAKQELLPKKQEFGDISLLVDARGIPVSTDPIWNACIRRTLHFDPTGRPFRCDREKYHSGNRWYHPDIPHFAFTWNGKRSRLSEMPGNVTLVKLNSISAPVLLAAAKNHKKEKGIITLETRVALRRMERLL